jgi:PAS domain S-box-containing protein
MIRVGDLPIRRKLTLSIVFTCAAALLLACGAFVAYDVASFRREIVEKVGSLAGVIGNNTTAALEFNDPKSAADTLSSLHGEPNIVAAFIHDPRGGIFATYRRVATPPFPPSAPPPPAATHEFLDDHLRLSRPIVNQGERIGTIVIVSDLTQLSARVGRFAVIVALVFAVSLLLAVGLSTYFERLLIRPILRLAALTHTVAIEKKYSGRAAKENNDEIGQLIDGFNHMLAQLEAREAELQQAHALLEKRVEERTAALRLAQADATREQARFKLIFDAVPIGIGLTVARPGARDLRLYNDAHLRLCGLTREQADEPGAFQRISHPDDYARQIPLLRQLAEGRIHQFSLEKRYLTPDGRTVWVVHSVQRHDHGGGAYEDLSTVVDITERKQAELRREQTEIALRTSEDKFAKAFRTHPDAISIARLSDNVLLEINPGFTRLLGYSAAEAIGRSALPGDLGIWSSAEIRERLVHALRQTGETTSIETRFRRRDGAFVVCAVSAGLMEIGGEPCMLAITRDLTAHKRLEEQLVRAGKMDAVGQLAGGVAHDYNNILTATLLQLELLLASNDLSPEIRAALLELKKMANRSASLTRQLLAFSRQQVIQVQTVELNEVIVQLLRMLSRLLGENIRVSFQGTADLLWLDADVGMIEQVVTNLCINARDAMLPQGGLLTIATARVVLPADIATQNPEASPGTFVCLSVEDTGCGMDATTLQHIFEPFFTTKEVGKGTGLGLATVYGIAKQHRGWVEVHSEVGRGTTFRAFFPAAKHDPRPAAEAAPPSPSRGHETILVVEDEEMVRLMVTYALKRSGYRVLEAVDGVAALRLWEEHSQTIALVVSDMVMPNGVTGLDLTARFKCDRPNLKVIITSGYSVDLRHSGIPAGQGVTYLAKPFDVSRLNALVRESLDGA